MDCPPASQPVSRDKHEQPAPVPSHRKAKLLKYLRLLFRQFGISCIVVVYVRGKYFPCFLFFFLLCLTLPVCFPHSRSNDSSHNKTTTMTIRIITGVQINMQMKCYIWVKWSAIFANVRLFFLSYITIFLLLLPQLNPPHTQLAFLYADTQTETDTETWTFPFCTDEHINPSEKRSHIIA